MTTILLLHSALGLRPGVTAAADRLRAAGHTVHTPDLFDGEAPFDEYPPAMARIEVIGRKELMARARAFAETQPADLVYAGFSMGAGFAAMLAVTRPGARAMLFLHDNFDPAYLPVPSWPAGVAAQIHCMANDPWSDGPEVIAKLAAFIEAGPAGCEVFDYPGSAHLFTDPSLPAEFDPQAAELLWTRVIDFLAELDAGAAR
jgi:dienelactone hydrolase